MEFGGLLLSEKEVTVSLFNLKFLALLTKSTFLWNAIY